MATINPFDDIRLTAAGQEQSYQWYRKQVTNLMRNASINQTTTKVIRETPLVSTILPGGMYLFYYNPKHKDTLPYYDKLPLVLPFRKVPDGFYGINLHYLPYMLRFRILKILSDYTINNSADTRVRLSWKLLNSISRLDPAKMAVKHYLNSHVQSRFHKIEYADWITASQLPIEQFVGSNKTNIWRDTVNRSSPKTKGL